MHLYKYGNESCFPSLVTTPRPALLSHSLQHQLSLSQYLFPSPCSITPCPPLALALPAAASSSSAKCCFIFSNWLALPNGSRCRSPAGGAHPQGPGWLTEVV